MSTITRHILLVDNIPETLILTSEYLEQNGYAVQSAAQPFHALVLFIDYPIDLAVIDVRLQNENDEHDKSGIKLAQILQLIRPLPIIVVSTYRSVSAVRKSLHHLPGKRAPAVYFLLKREGYPALLDAIEQALTINTVHLLEKMTDRFNETDFKMLCLRLQLSFTDLAGFTLRDRMLSLLEYQQRRTQLHELVRQCRELRPDQDW